MILARILFLFASLTVLISFALGQPLGKKDFKLGALELRQPFDSISAKLGKPDSARIFGQDWDEFTGYYYPKLVLWIHNQDKQIWAFDIYDTSFVTNRGLRIGDSVHKIERLYPKRYWIDREFSRVGPYDDTFNDYSEVTIYEYRIGENDAWFLILFTKNDRLVKMLFYIGVYE